MGFYAWSNLEGGRAARLFGILGFVALAAVGCGDDDATGTSSGGNGGSGGGGSGGVGNSGAAGGVGGDGGVGGNPDTTAPGPVSDLTAVDDGSFGLDVSWTNPNDADLAGVLVVRGDGVAVDFDPTTGDTYSVGDPAGTDQVVDFASLGEGFTFAAPVPALTYGFTAWAYDSSGNYSAPVSTDGLVNGLAPQPGTIEVAIATPGVTVTTQPPFVTLGGTAAYDAGGQTLTVSLSVQNDTARLLFNPKAVITSTSQGTVTGLSTFGGDPYAYYGVESLPIGMPRTRDIVITGVDGSVDPVVIDLTVLDSRMLVMPNFYTVTDSSAAVVDVDFGVEQGFVPCDGNTNQNDNANATGKCNWRPGVMSDDGKLMYVGHRALPLIRTVDTTTFATVAQTNLAPAAAYGSVDSVVWSADHTQLYAVLNTGGHSLAGTVPWTNASQSALVRINPATLTEIDRLTLHDEAVTGQGRARLAAVSSDGSMAAVPIKNEQIVQLVDLASFTLIDTDAVTGGQQPLDVSASGSPKRVVFNAAGDKLYVGYAQDVVGLPANLLDEVDLTDYSITPVTTAVTAQSVGHMALDGAGNLWVSWMVSDPDPGVSVFDLSGASPSETTLAAVTTGTENANGFGFSADGTTAYVTNPTAPDVAVFDVATMTRLDTDGNNGNGVTNIPLATPMSAHAVHVSPY